MSGLIRGLLVLVLLSGASAEAEESAAWAALAAGGHVAMIRHANAPGPAGDPEGFDPAACETQRNLDAQGRDDAAKLGEQLRRRDVTIGRLLSSAWCRCRDTAMLLGFGEPEIEPALNNLISDRADPSTQVPAMRALVAGWRGPGTLVLVSHGVTIGALTGVRPQSAETVVLRPAAEMADGFTIVGRIPPPM